MTKYQLNIQNITRYFGRRLIFEKINFSAESGNIIGLTGPNGSGKSTLLQIIAGINSPSSGKIEYKKNDEIIKYSAVQKISGFVAPYLVLYDEFSALENLEIYSRIRGTAFNSNEAKEFLDYVGLKKRHNDQIRTYSSGMKQRLKFAFAMIHKPFFLFFDEPTSNLDDDGKKIFAELVKNQNSGQVVFIASNEENELQLCNKFIEIVRYK